ncbi:translation elongation factor Ts (EF-Ts) [Arboricoccus pini]|uniref:Elongation factor Ts n=1 Tax=Arboricoccus pini TaxID=1963835 RepID=A0A212R790_9PROT|nr:translation elongation factor Ts [Arboricoccus pini]SNB68017.1 translation elongation factor Ts (EF-Ts) [Arboricoccus pini]
MAQVTPALVKQLREQSGAGMMDCKKALEENGGDIEAATDWLRKKGLAAAAKKAGRVAAEGLIGLALEGPKGVLVEVNSETDFVARNETFQSLVREVTALALSAEGDVEKLKTLTIPSSGLPVEQAAQQAIGVIGENITVRRTSYLAVQEGVVAGYMHSQAAPGLGKIGVLVALQSKGDPARLAEVGKQIAMHVAAANPQALDIASIDPTLVDRERAIFADQAKASGKPDNIVEKMVEGRIRKFYEEAVLLEQVFVVDTDKRVKQVVEAAAKELGTPVALVGFIRLALGEGLAKEEQDLASEVAKLTQG